MFQLYDYHPLYQRDLVTFDYHVTQRFTNNSSTGLTLVLHIQTQEYLASLVSASGAVVAVHPYGSAAFPEINALSLAAGQETLFGIHLVSPFVESLHNTQHSVI